MKIHTPGHGTPLWLSPRTNDGLIVVQGHSKVLLSAEELQQFVDAIRQMTGVYASERVTAVRSVTTPAKAVMQRYRMA